MKKLLPDLIAILAFVLLSFAYFFPADIENRILFQHTRLQEQGQDKKSRSITNRRANAAVGQTRCSAVCPCIR